MPKSLQNQVMAFCLPFATDLLSRLAFAILKELQEPLERTFPAAKITFINTIANRGYRGDARSRSLAI